MISSRIDGSLFYFRQASDVPMFEEQMNYMRVAYETPSVHVEPGDIVLDGGANYGAFIHYALCNDADKVIAFEPHPEICDCLRKTYEHTPSVIIHRKALSSKNSGIFVLEGSRGDNSQVSYTTKPGDHFMTSHAVAFDSIMREVNFVKLDVEGHELEALEGMKKTLKRYTPKVAICAYHNFADKNDIKEIGDFLLRYGYRISVNPNEGYPVIMGD